MCVRRAANGIENKRKNSSQSEQIPTKRMGKDLKGALVEGKGVNIKKYWSQYLKFWNQKSH